MENLTIHHLGTLNHPASDGVLLCFFTQELQPRKLSCVALSCGLHTSLSGTPVLLGLKFCILVPVPLVGSLVHFLAGHCQGSQIFANGKISAFLTISIAYISLMHR